MISYKNPFRTLTDIQRALLPQKPTRKQKNAGLWRGASSEALSQAENKAGQRKHTRKKKKTVKQESKEEEKPGLKDEQRP